MALGLVCLILAALCFFMGALNVTVSSRVNLVTLGLFFWVLSILVALGLFFWVLSILLRGV